MSPQTFALLVAAAVGTSALSATVGMAGGLVLLVVLSSFMPASEAIPIHGFTQFFSNANRVALGRKDIRWDLALPFILPVIPGAWLGGLAVGAIPESYLDLGVALVILAAVLIPPFGAGRTPPRAFFPFLGFGSAFLGMLVGASGPMIAPFFAGLRKREMVATKAFCQWAVHFVKLPAFIFVAGVSFEGKWKLLAALAAATVVGTQLGDLLLARMSERTYERAVKAALLILALRMVFGAVTHFGA